MTPSVSWNRILIAVVGGASLGVGLLLFTPIEVTFLRSIGLAFICAICGLILARIAEGVDYAAQSVKNLEAVCQELQNVSNKVDKFHKVMTVINVVKRSDSAPFAAITKHQLEAIEDRLTNLAESKLHLKREEIAESWEYLIGSSVQTIDATNIVSSCDWKQFTTNSGLDAHRKALSNGVNVRRVLIFDEHDIVHGVGVADLEGQLKNLGIAIRRLSRQDPILDRVVRKFGTVDMVIFDKAVVLHTWVDDQKRMVHARVLAEEKMVKDSLELYEQIWNNPAAITV